VDVSINLGRSTKRQFIIQLFMIVILSFSH